MTCYAQRPAYMQPLHIKICGFYASRCYLYDHYLYVFISRRNSVGGFVENFAVDAGAKPSELPTDVDSLWITC